MRGLVAKGEDYRGGVIFVFIGWLSQRVAACLGCATGGGGKGGGKLRMWRGADKQPAGG
jgi:hypothetical protein